MNSNNKILFHISRESKWKIGDIIVSGKTENPFWLLCKDYSPQVRVNNQPMPIFKMFDQFSTFDVTQANIDWLYEQLKTVSKETSFYIREQVFEEIRRNNFPLLPSRQNCLWLTDEEHLPYWKTMSDNEQRYLLTLELDGNLFCGDDYWLTADTFSSIEYANRAVHYWSGELSTSPHKEYLFNGKALIKEVIPLQ